MFFNKKNRWIFILISCIVFFFVCYTVYYMDGYIEGAVTYTQNIPGSTSTTPVEYNMYQKKTVDSVQYKTKKKGYTNTQIEVAGVVASCKNDDPKAHFDCIKNIYETNKSLIADNSYKNSILKCPYYTTNKEQCFNNLISFIRPIIPYSEK